ncbi:Uncharacterized protein TCM_001161 [Theobroma cacao]|uniref:Uncharacterized protein n=1 Tax=Theobroma cacao TaxID=3641 RepID=A0A061DIU2_THECC|nr:Uncharacterized protein TCM_001161 [Theobroma cacao]
MGFVFLRLHIYRQLKLWLIIFRIVKACSVMAIFLTHFTQSPTVSSAWLPLTPCSRAAAASASFRSTNFQWQFEVFILCMGRRGNA